MTLLEDFLNYKRERGVKEESVKNYGIMIGTVLQKAKELGLNDDPKTMTERDFRMSVNAMNLTSNSINTKVTTFKMFLKFVGNPIDCKFLTNKESPNAKWISEERFFKILNECRNPTTKIILHLGGNYGLRRSEIANLKESDFIGGFIRVCGKGHGKGKTREVPLITNDPYIEEYNKWKSKVKTEAIRDDSGGSFVVYYHMKLVRKLEPVSISGRMKDYFDSIGVDATTHSLRREFVTTTYRAGVDIITIQRLVGHTSPQTTERYIQNDKQSAIDAMNKRNIYISNNVMT